MLLVLSNKALSRPGTNLPTYHSFGRTEVAYVIEIQDFV